MSFKKQKIELAAQKRIPDQARVGAKIKRRIPGDNLSLSN